MFLGWLWSIFRPIISVTLGLVVFFGLLAFLLVDNVRDNFLVSEFYTENLAANEVYTRFYDEVLLDEEYKDTTEDLLGDVGVDQKDIAHNSATNTVRAILFILVPPGRRPDSVRSHLIVK